MMLNLWGLFCLFFAMLLSVDNSSAYALCSNSRSLLKLEAPLEFCPYSGSSCCDSAEDMQIKMEFEAMNVTDPVCASLLKSILCARCDQFSGKMFKFDTAHRNIPTLCYSKIITVSSQSENSPSGDFCTKVWDTCGKISMKNSPFLPAMKDESTESANLLTDKWESREDFCGEFGGHSEDGTVCFGGGPLSFDNVEAAIPFQGLCIEKISNGSYIDMNPHPDGSKRVFFTKQQGKIWLADIPEQGSNRILEMDDAKPFLDISDNVLFDTEFGLLSTAFHPNFTSNGRFFASYNCDKMQQPNCVGRCSCNTDVNCDPSTLHGDNGVQPCQYHSVVGEFSVNGTASVLQLETILKAFEVRRILTIGLPLRGVHAGQILFGPEDGYLYFTIGDGSRRDDPYNLAQNKKSLLGKVLRLDVDNMSSEREIYELGLWGNYSIPKDNPYVNDKELSPEIFALGFRNPWRCSFDSERPSYFFCGDVGQEEYEEVDMVLKGGNYGWRVYEGPYPFNPKSFPGGKTSEKSIKPVFPVIYYNHSMTDNKIGSASAIGGYFYRSMTDPCLHGRYIFADLYGAVIFAATEVPENSRNFATERIPFKCAHDSPMKCSMLTGSAIPALGYVISLGEDNNKDLYFLTTTGVYRVVEPSRCNYTCSAKGKIKRKFAPRGPSPPPPGVPLKSSGDCQNTDFIFLILSFVIYIGLHLVHCC